MSGLRRPYASRLAYAVVTICTCASAFLQLCHQNTKLRHWLWWMVCSHVWWKLLFTNNPVLFCFFFYVRTRRGCVVFLGVLSTSAPAPSLLIASQQPIFSICCSHYRTWARLCCIVPKSKTFTSSCPPCHWSPLKPSCWRWTHWLVRSAKFE